MGILDIVKGFIIGILILILMTAIPLYIIMNSIQSNLLQQSYYETQFENTGVYLKIHSALLNLIVSQGSESDLQKYGMTKEDVKNAMSKSITKEWVKSETDRIIRNLLWYLNDETKGANLSISIKPKLIDGMANLVSEKAGISKESALSLVASSGIGENIPDPITIEKVAPGTTSALAELKKNVLFFKSTVSYLFIGIIVIIGLIFLLTISPKKFAGTLGLPLLVIGILLSLGSFLLPNLVRDAVADTGITSSQQVITITNIIDFLSPIFQSILFQALTLIAIGIILIVFSLIYPMIIGKKEKGN